ncbi:hypothetical protein HDU86_001373 [Geranomyces michiganensis]|nr:hypothetical protein HDU86_001373 [Geranomyces michiganensis]
MAEAAARAAPRVRNQVHDAAIWRQTISYELSTAKEWEQNWGFMRELYEQPSESGERKNRPKKSSASTVPRAFISGLPSKLPPGLTDDPKSHTADLLCIHDVTRITRSLHPKQKYTYPATTQQEIGWDWEADPAEQQSKRTGGKEGVAGSGDLGPEKQNKVGKPKAKDLKSDVEAMQRHLAGDANPNPVRYRTLECFGREARGQGDVLSWWGGTRDSLP